MNDKHLGIQYLWSPLFIGNIGIKSLGPENKHVL